MFENVNKDLLKKALQAETKDEAVAILKEGGVELTDDDLKSIAAGTEGDESTYWMDIYPRSANGAEGESRPGNGDNGKCDWYCRWLWI